MYVMEPRQSTYLCHPSGKYMPTYLLVYANLIFLFGGRNLGSKIKILLLRNQAMKSKKKVLIGDVLELNLDLNLKVHIQAHMIKKTF